MTQSATSEARSDRSTVDTAQRTIRQYFDIEGERLLIGGVCAKDLAARFGTPLFAYDAAVVRRKVAEVRSTLSGRFSIFYSIKANPAAALLKLLISEGCGLEVASGGELMQALAAGCPPEMILFAGPGKSETELAAAIDARILEIHAESLDELEQINRLASNRGHEVSVALRVNPVDAAGGAMRMSGKPSQFGIDEECLDEAIDLTERLQNVRVSGVHIFMGTQILDAAILDEQYRRAVVIARRVAERTGPLRRVDFGGGWGTPYFAHENPLDLAAVADVIVSIDRLLAAEPLLSKAAAIIEPGRFLVNEAGVYLTEVIRIKESRGKRFAIVDGGMHHHLAASGNLGQTIKRNYPIAVVNRVGAAPAGSTEIVGPLCTPLDTVGRNVALPALRNGDILGILLSGAYARSASPQGFLSHPSPPEVLVENGIASEIRARGAVEDFLRDQALEYENG
jgi:diaminopimelate decarboxylase